jgi:uncharacterized OsmC-like protein
MGKEIGRSVRVERTSLGHYRVENARGGSITIATGLVDSDEFTPVELLLAAIGGCTAADVDFITHKRADPTAFAVTVAGDKIRDEAGNRMANLEVTFEVQFPEGTQGDAAREILQRAVERSHDRLCTVSRTVEVASPIATVIKD